ncbi:hypothetical protein Tco_0886413 [Tanacetum coccineum]
MRVSPTSPPVTWAKLLPKRGRGKRLEEVALVPADAGFALLLKSRDEQKNERTGLKPRIEPEPRRIEPEPNPMVQVLVQ